ncbi:hypothetical protein [Kutzneria sp. 744]|jgi:hypothetical protein|uniref:hypothetical protein n=1 Tax=Kutzneria sp. (strain 744) TaxID=345341 RepID=UPI0003EEAF0B|nr:hypothetical protein [Kutzneria sp. 744]EWM10145.1 hypothetical protein KUTG_00449 [Kutzneria sp. 744]
MTRLRRFLFFWYDFVVGDDWRMAVAVVAALVITFVLAGAGLPAWWVLSLAVLVVLPLSLRHATRDR